MEVNVQVDHIHTLVKVPPKEPISKLLRVMKGKTALRSFTRFPYFRKKPYWGNHFWAKGYYVDTVGVDAKMIRRYESTKKSRSSGKRSWTCSDNQEAVNQIV